MTKVSSLARDDGRNEPRDDPELEWLAQVVIDCADAAGIGVLVVEVQPSVRTVYASRAAAEIFESTPDGLIDISPPSYFSSADRLGRASEWRALVEHPERIPATVEATGRRKDGAEFSLDVSLSATEIGGRPAVVAFIVNVTKRRLAQQSLRLSEERFRNVVERVPEAIFITDGTTLHYANPAFVAVLGLSKDDGLDGLSVVDFAHPDDATRLVERARAAVGFASPVGEYRLTARGGRVVIMEITSIGIDLDDRPMILWFGREVTERKQMESQLMQADRLAALGTLAGGMAHAINNPLSYVLLNLEHLSRRLPDLRTGRDYLAEARVRLNEAEDGAERVAAVVRQMRLFSRMRRVEKSGLVSVTAVLEGALQLVGNEIRHRGQLVTALRDVPRVVGREGQMEQAFLPLLIFAARLLPEESDERGQMHIATRLDDQGRVEVTVRCVGAPLHAAVRQRIFEPFGGGADEPALGLAMCADILQSMKGGIVVDGNDSETVFRVVLPAAAETTAEDAHEAPASEHPATPASGARARVLVIDDDPGVSSALRLMLQDAHDVTSVGSARDALELLLGGQDFDIVFCDFVMPDMSGEDVYYALKLNRPGTESRLVFMTGAVFSSDAERFLGQIDNPRLEKPFHLPRVEELVSAAVRDGRDRVA